MRHFNLRRLLMACVLLILAACSESELIEKFTSPEEVTRAKHMIGLLQAKHYEEIMAVADASIADDKLPATLAQMGEMLPRETATSIKLIGAHRNTVNGVESVNLSFEYEFSGKYFLTNAAFKTDKGRRTLIGMSVIPQPASLEAQNAFALAGKSVLQYAVLVLAVLFPLFSLAVLIICIRTRLQGRKWPWVLFIVFGVGRLGVNWASGQWSFMPLAVQLFSASAITPINGPLSLYLSLPLGAILFLAMRNKLRADAADTSKPAMEAV